MKEFWKYYYTICDLCRRNEGLIAEKNEPYLCKYNKNKKISSLEMDNGQRFKCKYFKRNNEEITSEFIEKSFKRSVPFKEGAITYNFKYKKGKLKVSSEVYCYGQI